MPGSPIIDAQGVVPEKALAYWKDKQPMSAADFDKLDSDARGRAFAVAGLARRDMAGDLHSSLYEAMKSGETFEQWKRRIPDIITANGWRGHRLENIFQTNVQTAYNAGRYAQMREVAKARPYWQYLAVGDSRTRPAHMALHQMVFPADHEFWDSHYPPNGFRCRCTVCSLSSRQVSGQGLEVQKETPQDLLYKDPATGMEIPVASVTPPAGFATNPGKRWLDGLSPAELSGLDLHELAHAKALKKGITPPLASLPAKHILPVKPGDILPQGLTDKAYLLAFLKEFGLNGLDEQTTHLLPGVLSPLVIDKYLFVNKFDGSMKASKGGRGPLVRLLARTIRDPYEIWHVPVELSGRTVSTLRLIRLFAGEDQEIGGFGVFSLVGNAWQGSTVFAPGKGGSKAMLEYLERQRVGTLVYREK